MIYVSPTPLSPVRHRDCCVDIGNNYAFSRSVNSIPLLAAEFTSAASEYVIVFGSAGDAITPAVLIGIRESENAYLDDRSAWRAAYVPAYVRRYPFVFSSADEGKTLTLCVDEACPGLNREARGERLFDAAGKPAPFLESMIGFLREYQAHAQRTQAFCATLQRLGILQPIRLDMTSPTGAAVRLEGVMAVDRGRLRGLSGDALASLVRTDDLELIHLHLHSMRNISALESRLLSRAGGVSRPNTPPSRPNIKTRSGGGIPGDDAARETADAAPKANGRTHWKDAPSAGLPQSSSHPSPFNAEFIFRECGFDWVPHYIDRDLLFNVSYDLQTGEMKLYVLARSRDFIYKISANAISKQYDAVMHGADPSRLSEFLGTDFDFQDLLLDTVEDDVYYVFVEESSAPQCLRFFRALCEKFGVTEGALVSAITRINRRSIDSLDECCARKAVSLIKVPFTGAGCKVYSRPLLMGNGYDLSAEAVAFLTRLYDCRQEALAVHLRHLWVSSELTSERIVISTQHHDLVHRA